MSSCDSKGKYYSSPRISSEYKDCSLPLTFDQYNRCSFGCKYCFGVQFKECNPAYKKIGNMVKGVNYERLIKIIKGEYPENPYYKNFFKHRFVFHWGGLNDPFCHMEKHYNVGLELIKALAELKYPTLFSTKGLSLYLDKPEYMKVFEESAKNKNFAFQFSIVANADELSLGIEPNTPTTSERLRAMQAMSKLGYWTILRLRPFLIGISDIDLETLLERSKEAGANAISTEFFALDSKIVDMLKDNIKVIKDLCKFDFLEMYKKTSPHERGGYMRSNRDVKEPIMKRLYSKCKELGLQINISDPDYKELNESGCCCGLPDEFKDNPEITNWSRGQLTYALIQLRKRYYDSKGEDKFLTFEDIDKNVPNRWYDDRKYYGDSIKMWSTDYSKKEMNHGKEYKESWNNLRSPDNPQNYFHGVLKPHHVDDNGMIVYEYNPKPYEQRWMKEGIL